MARGIGTEHAAKSRLLYLPDCAYARGRQTQQLYSSIQCRRISVQTRFKLNWVMTTTMFVSDVKPENSRLLAAALRDTVPVWAPIVIPQERTTLLIRLGKARMANKNAGIDDDINAIEAVMKSVKD
jgi:hypothetical protein